jgi:hypothetical protein
MPIDEKYAKGVIEVGQDVEVFFLYVEKSKRYELTLLDDDGHEIQIHFPFENDVLYLYDRLKEELHEK